MQFDLIKQLGFFLFTLAIITGTCMADKPFREVGIIQAIAIPNVSILIEVKPIEDKASLLLRAEVMHLAVYMIFVYIIGIFI